MSFDSCDFKMVQEGVEALQAMENLTLSDLEQGLEPLIKAVNRLADNVGLMVIQHRGK